MKKTVVSLFAGILTLVTVQSTKAQTIAQWTFETIANTNGLIFVPGANTSPGTVQADNGLNFSGSVASGLHATAATYSTPAGDLDHTIAALDPSASAANSSPSLHSFSATGWSVGDYWSFTTSTLGFTGITVAFDQAGSGTGPGNFGLSYSINGGSFAQFATYTVPASNWNTTTDGSGSELFAGGGAFDNASSITFRLVDLNTTSTSGGTVGTGGTDRVDNFTVISVVPEPSTIALAGLGGAACLLAFRRRR